MERSRSMRRVKGWVSAGLAVGALLAGAGRGGAASGDLVADRVLGQDTFTAAGANLVDGRGLSSPSSLAIDRSRQPNRLYVADAGNNRVLGWRDPASFRRGAPADLVIGQPDFASTACKPEALSRSSLCLEGVETGLAVDSRGNLFVSDPANFRVLEYDSPFETDAAADRVFGQASFNGTDRSCIHPETDVCFARQLAVDGADNLYVLDFNRVVRFDRPLETDLRADRVYAGDDGGGVCAPQPTCYHAPAGIAVDAAGNLYLSDLGKHWVLVFLAASPAGSGPDREVGREEGLGAPDRNCREPLPTATTLCGPRQIAIDGEGRLYVADEGNARVAVFDRPLVSGRIDRVLGPPDGSLDRAVRACGGGPGLAASFCSPRSVAADGSGNVYVADIFNHRVLRFDRPSPAGDRLPDGVLGQADFLHATVNRIDARGLAGPSALALDTSVHPPRLYVSDGGNSRILAWRDATAFRNGEPADLVIGQPDRFSQACPVGSPGPARLCLGRSETTGRSGIAVDGRGNLFIADTGHSRVLELDSPFDTDTVADRVYGQRDFGTTACNEGGRSAGTLCFPSSVALDGRGSLYVADTHNQRVVIYRNALRETRSADRVLGQKGFRAGLCSAQVSARSFCFPLGLAVDRKGDLFVSDTPRSRVLRFRAPLEGDDVADQVLGQAGFSSAPFCDQPALRKDSLCDPAGLAFDDVGRLLVGSANLRWVPRFRNLDRSPEVDLLLGCRGQGGGNPLFCPNLGVNAESILAAQDVAVDADGVWYVADTGHNRVLVFERP